LRQAGCEPSLPDKYLSIRELAEYSGLSVRTLQRHLASSEHSLPRYRIGRRVLVKRSEFDAWMIEWRQAYSEAEQMVRRALGDIDTGWVNQRRLRKKR
jgi:excisionase family DNA binding protein